LREIQSARASRDDDTIVAEEPDVLDE